MSLNIQQAHEALEGAEEIFSSQEVQAALQHVAAEVNNTLADSHPLVLAVMGGAVVFAGQLLPLLRFPLDFDYVHVSRYGGSKQGGELNWKIEPRENVAGRTVLVLDDVLDEGETLTAIKRRVLDLGAAEFYSAVFADKMNGRDKPIRADFVGLELPNRFVFGFGMDIHGAWRNLPAIYATKED